MQLCYNSAIVDAKRVLRTLKYYILVFQNSWKNMLSLLAILVKIKCSVVILFFPIWKIPLVLGSLEYSLNSVQMAQMNIAYTICTMDI